MADEIEMLATTIHALGMKGDAETRLRAIYDGAEKIRALVAREVQAERERWAALLSDLVKWSSPPGDWTCAKCRPYSDMLTPGFLCAYHDALAALGTPPDPTSSDAATTAATSSPATAGRGVPQDGPPASLRVSCSECGMPANIGMECPVCGCDASWQVEREKGRRQVRAASQDGRKSPPARFPRE
jgi:hypothetical protein